MTALQEQQVRINYKFIRSTLDDPDLDELDKDVAVCGTRCCFNQRACPLDFEDKRCLGGGYYVVESVQWPS